MVGMVGLGTRSRQVGRTLEVLTDAAHEGDSGEGEESRWILRSEIQSTNKLSWCAGPILKDGRTVVNKTIR